MCHEQCALNHDATESLLLLRCVINKPTMDDLCISPVYRPLAVAKVHNVEIAHVTLTTPTWENSLITRLRLHMADLCTRL